MTRYPVPMHWWLVVTAGVIPLVFSACVAWLFWRKGVSMHGAIVGALLLFLCSLGFFLREGIEISRTLDACNAAGILCPVSPEPFTRFAIYGIIAMAQTMVLFVLDHRANQRRARSQFAAQWRRG